MILLDNFASAAFIAPECMSKRPLVGVSQGTTFSDEQILMNSVEPEMLLYGYLECNDENGDIDKFEFVVADENA